MKNIDNLRYLPIINDGIKEDYLNLMRVFRRGLLKSMDDSSLERLKRCEVYRVQSQEIQTLDAMKPQLYFHWTVENTVIIESSPWLSRVDKYPV